MGAKYNEYIREHKENVEKAYSWLVYNLPELFKDKTNNMLSNIQSHDESKFSIEEYEAYDNYFYGSAVPDQEVKDAFNKAWLHHIHNNPHHWQHWVLINDDYDEIFLEIPYEYIIEMICDWWSFSWRKGNLFEIFDWYDEHKTTMKINHKSREVVERILNMIKNRLEETNYGAN